MAYPQITNTLTERIGVHSVALEIIQAGSIFRETSGIDVGIDGIIEISQGGFVTGKHIGVQIKCGMSYIKNGVEIKPSTLNYWISCPFPVIIIIVNPLSKEMYWISATSYLNNRKGPIRINNCMKFSSSTEHWHTICQLVAQKDLGTTILNNGLIITYHCNYVANLITENWPAYYSETAIRYRFQNSLEYKTDYPWIDCQLGKLEVPQATEWELTEIQLNKQAGMQKMLDVLKIIREYLTPYGVREAVKWIRELSLKQLDSFYLDDHVTFATVLSAIRDLYISNIDAHPEDLLVLLILQNEPAKCLLQYFFHGDEHNTKNIPFYVCLQEKFIKLLTNLAWECQNGKATLHHIAKDREADRDDLVLQANKGDHLLYILHDDGQPRYLCNTCTTFHFHNSPHKK